MSVWCFWLIQFSRKGRVDWWMDGWMMDGWRDWEIGLLTEMEASQLRESWPKIGPITTGQLMVVVKLVFFGIYSSMDFAPFPLAAISNLEDRGRVVIISITHNYRRFHAVLVAVAVSFRTWQIRYHRISSSQVFPTRKVPIPSLRPVLFCYWYRVVCSGW